MTRQGIDKAFMQVAVPDAGTRPQAGKDSKNCDDAFGHPENVDRQTKFDAVERPDSKAKELIGKQLGSNMMQSNGYDPETRSYINLAPRRGFDKKI
jgi:hypothetical protein